MEWVFSVRCLRDHLEAIRDGWLSSSARIGQPARPGRRTIGPRRVVTRIHEGTLDQIPVVSRDPIAMSQASGKQQRDLTFEPIGARSPRRKRWTDTQAPSRSRRLTVRRRRIAVTISFRANSKRVRHLRSSQRARVLSVVRAKRLIGPLHLYLSSTRRIWLVWCASWWVAASRLVQTLASSGRRPSQATRPNSKKQITGGTGPHAGEPNRAQRHRCRTRV